METTVSRIKKYIDDKGISVKKFEESVGFSNGAFASQYKNNKTIGVDKVENILLIYPDISPGWLLTGQGPMLKAQEVQTSQKMPVPAYDTGSENIDILNEHTGVQFYDQENKPAGRRLIPFYEDVSTVGGVNAMSADVDSAPAVSEWIDAGDWFRDATAAIQHYGDSMLEYPSGCILALKKVEDIRLLLWGKNYCIETDEYRITKQLQPGEDKNTLLAYSSNRETYPDGRLIHAPVQIPLESIRAIFSVLGCVIKEYNSGAMYIKK